MLGDFVDKLCLVGWFELLDSVGSKVLDYLVCYDEGGLVDVGVWL